MKCLVVCCFVIISCSFHHVAADSPGVCLVEHMKTKTRYVMNRQLNRWIMTFYQEPQRHRECCEGYRSRNSTLGELICDPLCEPECQNSNCEGVNLCVCLPGHMMVNNSTSTCVNICDSCVNSACSPEGNESECVCKEGFERDQNQPHVCNPMCNPPCENGTCDAPGVCKCFDNFDKEEDSHICRPICRDQCMFGDCTDVNECTCYQGYINDKDQPNICVPTCSSGCENGFCVAPDDCKCFVGFIKSLETRFKCVTKEPEKLSVKTTCEFNISKAIEHDKVSDCYLLKKSLIINETQCNLLNFLTDPKCRKDKDCRVSFRCTRIPNNGANKIHCNLETNDFETQESSNLTLPEMDWTDVEIELNSSQPTSFNIDFDHHRKWELRPLSKWPVCGEKFFGVEVVETTSKPLLVTEGSNFWPYFLILLSCLVLLLVGIGAKVFLWIRRRRLNDSLDIVSSNGLENPLYGEESLMILKTENDIPSDAGSSRYSGFNGSLAMTENLSADLANTVLDSHSENAGDPVYEEISNTNTDTATHCSTAVLLH